MGRLVVGLIGFLFVGLIAGGIAVLWAKSEFEKPGPLVEETTLVLPRGAGMRDIARRLQDGGVVRDSRLFEAGSRALGLARRFQAGEYRFPPGGSMHAVALQIVAGRTVKRRLTVPEGLRSYEVVALVRQAEGLVGEIARVPANGSLLPETYQYAFGDSRQGMLDRMRKAMGEAVSSAWAGRQPDLPLLTPRDAVILASIVEKETGLAEERPHIAGVFVNRLRKRMPLQSDPTVAFALSPDAPLGRALLRDDLKFESPFNTYTNRGLPPAPIANPGRAALEAVLQPLATKDLYFVADGTGGHAFAETYQAHRANVRKWRAVQKGQREAQ